MRTTDDPGGRQHPALRRGPAIPRHAAARTWWYAQLSGTKPVCLCWPVISAFIRIGTSARLHQRPLTLKEAVDRVDSWLAQPCVRIIDPGDNHWPLFQRMLGVGGAIGNLVSDAHLAALAIEHNCLLCSTDTDFAKFRGLKWENPL